MKDAETLIERFGGLKSERQPFEQEWRQIAYYMRPLRQEFRQIYFSGELPRETLPMITDSSANVALDNFVGGLFGFLSNPANTWFSTRSADPDLNRFHTVRAWNVQVTRLLLASYSTGVSPFYNQVPELYADTAAFGIGGFFSEWRTGTGRIHDAAYSPFEIYPDINNWNEIDSIYRPFWYTGRQAMQRFGDDAFHEKRKKQIEDMPAERFQILHVVHPNDDFIPESFGHAGKPFADIYLDIEHKHTIQTGGRSEFGWQVPRYSGNGKYGFGLGRRNLADAKTLNAMDAGLLEAVEWQNHPAILMQDEDAVSKVRPIPRKPIFGGMSPNGRRMVDFLTPNGNIPITFEIMQQRREQLRDAFYFSLMQLIGRTGMTATEVLERGEEKMRLMGPHLVRQQTEFLSPSIKQRFAMLWRAGQLPPPPLELHDQDIEIEYVSPMAKAQRAAEAGSVLRLVDGTVALMQLDPNAGDNIDGDEAVRILQDGFSTPISVLRDEQSVAALRQQRSQVQQASQALELGNQGADVAGKLVAMQRGEAVNG